MSEWPDALDDEVLAGLRAGFDASDPPPPFLDDLVVLALGSARLDAEVARLVDDAAVAPGARASTRVRTLRFEGGGTTVLLSVAEGPTGARRVDGWLVPAAAAGVALHGPAGTVTVDADASGRFSFEGVPAGAAQLVVQGPSGVVVTTAVQL
ncbi:carboxypeptidase regulatory-like domain-containing protein [Cellulomonas humilata]|uniref:Carboxypeptidase regulatory-like domain-containing protein n=1 Tax=Cellulomonas humilata TaxID=144055 RepID=A0A7Y6DXX3_9CELL|nr:carboxypeptidase regulatory-like domain-containing protein [Cellulomonas humilata]NUU17830.1 carboxypeptidase regulatory-like domain-containing protein [Cellulomonas humilata]